VDPQRWVEAAYVTSYRTAHRRARGARGDGPCDDCGERPGTDMALRHDMPIEHFRIDRVAGFKVFSPFPEDYHRLCRSCHTRYDKGRSHGERGWERAWPG
jgi:hypothetical protein